MLAWFECDRIPLLTWRIPNSYKTPEYKNSVSKIIMTSEKQNLVLVTADSLRADHCFTEFSGHPTTPTLERFAEDGVVFENAISPGARTATSVPEIITGEPMPYRTMEDRDHTFRLLRHVLSEHDSVFDRISEMGYTTAAISTSPYTTPETNIPDAFDHFHDAGAYEPSRLKDLVPGDTASQVAKYVERYFKKKTYYNQWTDFYDEIERTVDQLEEPYFLWVFLLDTHNPYLCPRADRKESTTFGMYYGLWQANQVHTERSDTSSIEGGLSGKEEARLRRAYRDTIRSVDRFVQTLWEDVQEDDPVLIFHSDHGEAFGEHGTYGHQPYLYEENIHVPLVIYNAKDDATSIDDTISLRQLPDMVTEYVEDDTPFSDEQWTSDYTCSRAKNGRVAIRGTRWKYIARNGTEELYDLKEDRGEQNNLADKEPELVAEFRERKRNFMNQIDDNTLTQDDSDIDDELQSRLQSLGYVE